MKQSFARQHSHHRDRTPSVIYLPPPKPPVAAERLIEPVAEIVPDTAMMALPEVSEPLVTERTEVRAPPPQRLNRQARRKALRAEAKALRREGQAPVAAVQLVLPEPVTNVAPVAASIIVEPARAAATATIATAEIATPCIDQPLPRGRSLVTARPRGLALFAHRLRAIFGIRRNPPAPAENPIAGQLRTLRNDLSALQQSLDRVIEGIAA